MAVKLEFSAKLAGMEQVLESLKKAESQLNDLGRVGSYAIDGVDRRMKEFVSSLDTITKSQRGMGGLFKSFDELNQKANSFLGKSYKSIVDGMRAEVRSFDAEVDKIKAKVSDAEKSLETFRSRRTSMSEAEYQTGVARRQQDLSQAQAQSVAMRNQQYEMQRAVGMAQPLPGFISGPMQQMGLGQYATVGAALRGLPYAAAGIGGAASVLQAGGGFGEQVLYTREVDSYLAQARLRRTAAQQAMSGDVTEYLLQGLGAGVEKKAMDSAWTQAKLTGTWLLDNPVIRAITGAGAGFAAGSVVPVLGNIGGAIAGGFTGFTTARNRTRAQIAAEEQGALRQRDVELYGVLGRAAGENFLRESQDLDLAQRMFGINSVHQTVSGLAAGGVSMDRGNPVLQMLAQMGVDPGQLGAGRIAGFVRGNFRFGVGDAAQQQLIRQAAINNADPFAGQAAAISTFGRAGLTGAGSISARTNLGEYVASLSSQRGAGEDFSTVGAGVAAAVGVNASNFNKVEGVQQGIINYEKAQGLISSGTSALDMVLVSKLRSIGVTNAVAIDAFIKMGLDDPKTQAAIAKYTGKDVQTVRQALSGAAGAYTGMLESVLGKDQLRKFAEATGGDELTLLTSGRRAFENTRGGGATFSRSLEAMLGGGPANQGPGFAQAVQPGQATLADTRDQARAQQQRQIDESLNSALEGTGKTVSDALTGAIVRGFQEMAKEVQSAGDRIVKDRAPTSGRPFGGTKSAGPGGY